MKAGEFGIGRAGMVLAIVLLVAALIVAGGAWRMVGIV
jgi:hypothetical protein